METFESIKTIFQSFLLVVASEMGDKTQLLALVLTARFKKPFVIMAGILVATLLNHGLASYAGGWVSAQINPEYMKWILFATFVVFGLWILIPDKDEGLNENYKYGAFLTTLVAFFLAEMGDKTQLATVALAAEFKAPIAVTIGTTLGMLVADGLAVIFGDKLTQKISMKWIRIFACVLFIVFGFGILFYK
ncbi:MAG: TMEM165/GDT1 family protein [Pseudobdellovibrio sp.]